MIKISKICSHYKRNRGVESLVLYWNNIAIFYTLLFWFLFSQLPCFNLRCFKPFVVYCINIVLLKNRSGWQDRLDILFTRTWPPTNQHTIDHKRGYRQRTNRLTWLRDYYGLRLDIPSGKMDYYIHCSDLGLLLPGKVDEQ